MRITRSSFSTPAGSRNPTPTLAKSWLLSLSPSTRFPSLIKTGQIDHAVCVAGLLWWLYLERTE